jgi:hypothetical protein
MRRLSSLVLALCLLAGCGGIAGAEAARPDLPPGPATFAAGTARATVTSTDGRTTLEGAGPVDLERRRSSLRFAHRFDAVVADGIAFLRPRGATTWSTVRAEELPQADPAQLLDLLADAPIDAFARLGRDRYRLAAGPLAITVWLDDHGRVRREELQLGGATTTLVLDRFGAPVRVRVPDHARTARGLADALG